MFMPEFILTTEDSMEEVAQKFHVTDKYNLPVLKDGKYVGFVSRANVFSEYRKMLKHFSED
jgi:CIC family chloride channel protein